jgi:hypothetical protein
MKSISLNMTSVEVKAETRALKCEWTRELSKDIDVCTSSFEIYIAKEIRRELRKKSINKIFKN